MMKKIASLCVGNASESNDNCIQCQQVAIAEERKSLSLSHQFMTERGCNEKSLCAFDVCKSTVDSCIAASEHQKMLDEF